MTATKHEIFKYAHKLAHQMKAKWPTDDYRALFAIALRDTYRQIAEHYAKVAAKVAAKAAEEAAKAAEEQAKAEAIKGDAIAEALVRAGANVWIKGDNKRIYLNLIGRYDCRVYYNRAARFFDVEVVRNGFAGFSRRCEGYLVDNRNYYDLVTHSWHVVDDLVIDNLRSEFKAA